MKAAMERGRYAKKKGEEESDLSCSEMAKQAGKAVPKGILIRKCGFYRISRYQPLPGIELAMNMQSASICFPRSLTWNEKKFRICFRNKKKFCGPDMVT